MAFTDTVSQANTIVSLAYDRAITLEKKNIAQLRSNIGAIRFPDDQSDPSLSVVIDRYQGITFDTTPIAENTDPDAFAIPDVIPVTINAAERGGFTIVNDKVRMLSRDKGLMASVVRRFADAEVKADDKLIEDALRASNNALVVKADKTVTPYASNGTTRYTAATAPADAAGTANSELVRRAVTTLKTKNVETIGGYYLCYADYQTIQDIRAEAGDTGWRTPANYTSKTELENGEVGAWEGVRFIENHNLAVGSDGVHRLFFLGQWALGANIVDDWHLDMNGTIVDPLNRRQPVAFKSTLGYNIFDPDAIVVGYVKTNSVI